MTIVKDAETLKTPSASRLCTSVALAGSAVGIACLLAGNGLPALGRKLAQAAAVMGESAVPLSLIVGSIALLVACLRFPRFGRLVGAALEWPVRIALTAVLFMMVAALATMALAMTAVAVVGWVHGLGVPIWFLAPSELAPTVVFGGFALAISLTALSYCRTSLVSVGEGKPVTSRRDKVFHAGLVAALLLVLPGWVMGSNAIGEAKVFLRTWTTAAPADASAPSAD